MATDAWEITFTSSADVTTDGDCSGSILCRTWTAPLMLGNASASQTINVTDTTAPVIAVYKLR
jgi:hypothetical protein